MIRIPSKTHNICIIQTYLDKVFEEHNLNRRFFGDVLTSITEAVNNAIIHGNHEDENKFVQIHLQRKTDGLVFTIKDEGIGFDPQSIPADDHSTLSVRSRINNYFSQNSTYNSSNFV